MEKRQRELTEQIASLDRGLGVLDDPKTRYDETKATLVGLHSERLALYQGQADNLAVQSDGALRAQVRKGTSMTRHAELLRSLAKGMNIRGDKLDSNS